MEKLQRALEKARHQRKNTLTTTDTRKPGPVGTVEQLWQALPTYEPDAAALKRNRIVTQGAGSLATPFDILRTKIILQMRRNDWRTLAITSPRAGQGKTTTCCNLMVGLTRQPDIRAIFCEFDLRRPSMAKVLACRPPHDITRMLTGEVSFAEQALRLKNNVAFSIAQNATADPTRYLLANETDAQLQKIAAQYRADLMIFDLPPLMAGDDTRAFLSKVDCALIVAQAEKATTAQIDATEREISEQTNVLGVVLNQCRFNKDATGINSYEDY